MVLVATVVYRGDADSAVAGDRAGVGGDGGGVGAGVDCVDGVFGRVGAGRDDGVSDRGLAMAVSADTTAAIRKTGTPTKSLT